MDSNVFVHQTLLESSAQTSYQAAIPKSVKTLVLVPSLLKVHCVAVNLDTLVFTVNALLMYVSSLFKVSESFALVV